MNILITGGAGFIGSNIANRLIDLGHSITIIDNESTGLKSNVPPKARYYKGSINSHDDLKLIFKNNFDAVLHIAGQVSIINSFTDPIKDLHTNTQGTLNILSMCIKHKISRFIYASSMTLYDNNINPPFNEKTNCSPSSYYGITKLAAESYVHATSNRSDLDFIFNVTSFRMFNVYGPNQSLDNPYQGVLGIFIGNVLRNEPITIFGDGNQTRDFIYIDDVVDAWVRALDNKATYGKILNLGSGKELSINEISKKVIDIFGIDNKTQILYKPKRPGEQKYVCSDNRKINKVLNWIPKVKFNEGLTKTIKWAKQNTNYKGIIK